MSGLDRFMERASNKNTLFGKTQTEVRQTQASSKPLSKKK